jgi:hypothetical protein
MRQPRRFRLPFVAAAVVLALAAAACASTPSPVPSAGPSESAGPTPTPLPTPEPTPRFTNEPDPSLSGLIPDAVGAASVDKPDPADYGLTPGDIGQAAYGELGLRFQSLVIAFVREPRLSLYAMLVNGPPVRTEDLEPYLATAGRYVGIAGLERDPWELKPVGDHWTWVRPSDSATLVGTTVYTWADGHYVFLMIGVDDAQNQAMLTLLPGETPPSPSPEPSSTGAGSPEPSALPSPS